MRILKWIYELGYKHAENKLYHQLLRAMDTERPDDLEMIDFEEKGRYSKERLQKRQEVSHRLRSIIDDVFKPEIYASVEYFEKNRFEL